MYGYFCIKFINYMLKGKTLFDYTNLFSPNDFKNNDRVIIRIFKNEFLKCHRHKCFAIRINRCK